jgi:hypothetical protein
MTKDLASIGQTQKYLDRIRSFLDIRIKRISMETAGQTLSVSLAYSASIRRRFVAGCAAVTEGQRGRMRRVTRGGGEAVVGSRAKEEAEERRERSRGSVGIDRASAVD